MRTKPRFYGSRDEARRAKNQLERHHRVYNLKDALEALKSRKRTFDTEALELFVTAYGPDPEVAGEIAKRRSATSATSEYVARR